MHKASEQQHRRIGLAAFGPFSGVIEQVKQLLDRSPVDGQIELFEYGQGAVFIGMDFDSKVDERELA